MILVTMGKNGRATYKESAEEWFDPDSPAAQQFEWPQQWPAAPTSHESPE